MGRKRSPCSQKGLNPVLGPGRKEIPEIYRKIGCPVIVGGSMETGSYLLVGTGKTMKENFVSTMHGSGRTMSWTAKKKVIGAELKKEIERAGIIVRAVSMAGLAEEAGFA